MEVGKIQQLTRDERRQRFADAAGSIKVPLDVMKHLEDGDMLYDESIVRQLEQERDQAVAQAGVMREALEAVDNLHRGLFGDTRFDEMRPLDAWEKVQAALSADPATLAELQALRLVAEGTEESLSILLGDQSPLPLLAQDVIRGAFMGMREQIAALKAVKP